MPVKTENQIAQSLIGFINNFLTNKNIDGWVVRQGNQPTMTGFVDKSIYVTRISSRRNGWQAHRDKWNEDLGQMVHSEEYIQEVLFQISAFKKRNPSDINELTSGDILNSLMTFLQGSAGIKAFRDIGFQTYRLTELREPVLVDDSELYEKIPSFDIYVILLQNEEDDIGYTDKYNINLKGI